MRYISILLAGLLATASCQKNKEINFSLTGMILDNTFGGGLDGAKLTLTEVPTGGASPSKQIASMTLGSSGGYALTFKRNKVENYILRVEKANYFTLEADISFAEFSTEKPLMKNYSTTAKSWVRIHLKNEEPALATDKLMIRKQIGKSDCSECCSGGDQFFTGVADTFLYCVNDANSAYSFYYNLIGSPNQGIQQAQTVAFDTVDIVLNY